jgi:DNA-binding NarL/FixJ family response regulator
VKLIIVDDHKIICDSLKVLLERDPAIQVVGTAADGHTGVELTLRLRPDVVIMDIEMPLLNGIEATRQLRAADFAGGIAMLSSHDERRLVLQAIEAGIDAYVLKQNTFDEVRDAIAAAGRREFFLSPTLAKLPGRAGFSGIADLLTSREREVLQLLAEGHTAKEIAVRFSLSPKTIEAHRVNLMTKLKVDNLADLTRLALREGMAKI